MPGLLRPSSGITAAAVAAAVLIAVVAPSTGPVVAAPCWLPPVDGTVIDPFRPPECRWCAGNRGIHYRVRANSPVRAVAGGEVTFSGSVAGRRYVVVRHADDRRVTYGLLDTRAVSRGDLVVRGQRIGSTTDEFHLGLRLPDDSYVDPAPFLGELRGRPRLVPIDGSRARPAPPPVLVCRPARPAARSAATPAPGSAASVRSDRSVGAVAGAR